jgi:hypothetical protein
MTTWPPPLRPRRFRVAARQLLAWSASGKVERGYRGCALQAITVPGHRSSDLAEGYAAKAFFTQLFRPSNIKIGQPWWPKRDVDARVIALLIAEQLARDINSLNAL